MQSILVCDDDKQIVEAIDIYLTGEGFEVIKAYDGAEALDVCRLLNPTVMLPMHYRTKYDEEMPTADLKTFLQLAKAEDQQMPLLRVVKADVHLRPEIVTLRIV